MTTAGIAPTAAMQVRSRSPFDLKGVYFHDGFDAEPKSLAPLYWGLPEWSRQIRWLKACGIGAIEFATMLEFNRVPSTDLERTKIAHRLRILDEAHRQDMKFGYLLTNTVVSTVPEGEEPGNQLKNRAVNLCPREPGNFEKTLANSLFYMKTYREADHFEQFAADWGGCECGRCGVEDFLRYVRAQAEELSGLNRGAKLFANTWCISYWRKEPMKDGWRGVFDREISGTREVIEGILKMPRHVGLGLPCHHLYRPLCFEQYGGKSATPAFPRRQDLEPMRRARRPILAWPHFVMDDDAFRPASWGIVHSESRYIRAMLQSLQSAGVNYVMGNLYLPSLQMLNAYAFGRMSSDLTLESRSVLEGFAKLVAAKQDASALAEALCWLENNSYWERQMPVDGRLPRLEAPGRGDTERTLRQVRPNPSPALPLPMPPAEWLEHLRRSVGRMTWA